MSIFEILLYLFLALLGLGLILNGISFLLPASHQIKSVFTVNAFQTEIKTKLFSIEGIQKWFYPSDEGFEVIVGNGKIEVKLKQVILLFLIEELNEQKNIVIKSGEQESDKSNSLNSILKIETESGKNGIEIIATEIFEFKKPTLRLLFKLHYKKAVEKLHQKRVEKIKNLF